MIEFSNATPSGSFALNPAFRSLGIGERLDVIEMADAVSGVEAKRCGGI